MGCCSNKPEKSSGNSNKLTVLPIISGPHVERRPAGDTEYKSGTAQEGYGCMTQAGVNISGAPGGSISATVNIDIKVNAVTQSDMKTWMDDLTTKSNSKYTRAVNESRLSVDGGISAFWRFLGLAANASYGTNHTDETVTFDKEDREIDQGFLDSLKSLTTSEVKVNGQFTLTSTSVVPVQAYLYVRTLNVKMKDSANTTFKFVDTSGNSGSTSVADKDGNQIKDVKATGKLKLVEL